jgi:myo-inositol 2-dehydrogenase/D-chiro-inositol 1-dehydrogenase
MPNNGKVKVGIIGSQFEADIHAVSFRLMPEEAEVVAIASPTPGNAEMLAKKYGIPRVFLDYRELLKEPDIEMVTITAPNRLHAQMTIDIANAGKHVVCEKPLCMTLAEADEMIDTCKRKGGHSRLRGRALLLAQVCQGQGNGGPGRLRQDSLGEAE